MPRKALLLWLILVLTSIQAWCLTLSDIRTQIRRHIRDTASSSSLQRYSDSTLTASINEAQRELVNATWPLQIRTSFTLVSGTTYYTMPTNAIVPKAVYYTNSSNLTYELKEEQEQSYRKNNPDYERQRGPPSIYFVRNSTSGASTQEIAFIPVATSASTGTVTMDYIVQATDLSSDSDVALNGDDNLLPYHDALVYEVVYRIKLLEGDITTATSYSQIYQNKVNEMMSRLGQSPNYENSIIAGSKR